MIVEIFLRTDEGQRTSSIEYECDDDTTDLTNLYHELLKEGKEIECAVISHPSKYVMFSFRGLEQFDENKMTILEADFTKRRKELEELVVPEDFHRMWCREKYLDEVGWNGYIAELRAMVERKGQE